MVNYTNWLDIGLNIRLLLENNMKFHYFLDNNAGWAGLLFDDKNVSLNYSISYFMWDSLTELLSGIRCISGSRFQIHSIENIHLDFAFEKDKFEWNIDQEGSCVKFIFSKINDSNLINLKIVELDDEEKCVYNDNIGLNDLIENILFSCSEILRKYGIIGYSLNFWNDFPVVHYLILKDFIKNEIKFDTFIEINNDREQDMFRTDYSKEIEYLK